MSTYLYSSSQLSYGNQNLPTLDFKQIDKDSHGFLPVNQTSNSVRHIHIITNVLLVAILYLVDCFPSSQCSKLGKIIHDSFIPQKFL